MRISVWEVAMASERKREWDIVRREEMLCESNVWSRA